MTKKTYICLTAILATTISFVCLSSPVRSMLGSDGAEICDGEPLTAADYVQAGLVCMWDGIENAGWGVHDDNATYWQELIRGEANFPKPKQSVWTEYGMYQGGVVNDYASANPGKYWSYVEGIESTYPEVAWSRENLVMSVEFVFQIDEITEAQQTANPYWLFAPLGFLRYSEYNYSIWGMGRGGAIVLNPDADWSFARSAIRSSFSVQPIGVVHHITFVLDGIDETTGIFRGAIYYDGDQMPVSMPTSARSYNVFKHFNVDRPMTFRLNTAAGPSWTFIGTTYAIRVYNRALTSSEVSYNYSVDKMRFGL